MSPQKNTTTKKCFCGYKKKKKKAEDTIRDTQIPCDSAAQWDTITGTISCSTNYSFNAIVDWNHSWHLMMHVFPDDRKIFQFNKAI